MNTSSTRDVRWLLVGTGDIAAKRVAPALSSVENSRLVGVVSRDANRASSFAAQVGASEAYGDLDDALANTSANAVYIASAVHLHAGQTVAAARAGKHILVEKPLGLNGADATAAANAAESAGVIAGCAYYRRFSARYDHAKQLIDRGGLGKILMVRMVYHADYNPPVGDLKHWRVVRSLSGGGPLADIGSHMIDLLIGLLGMPASVSANVATLVHSYDVEDTASVLLQMPDGAQVTGSFSWASKAWAHEFEIIGSETKIRWSPFDSGKGIRTAGRDVQELDLPMAPNVHAPLIADFVDAVLHRRAPRVPLREAARTNLVLDAIYQSSSDQQEVAR